MKIRYDLDLFYNNFFKEIEKEEKNTVFPSHFYKSYYNGETNVFQRIDTSEKEFDLNWIRAIESYFPSIDSITRNLKSTLKYNEEEVPVEKIKRVTRRSVVHLTANTHLIREINDEEEITPNKVLTDNSEVEYGIYENRFIMTLINRVSEFVSERVKIIRKDRNGFKRNHLKVNSHFVFNESNYEINYEIKEFETLNKRRITEHNDMILERAERLEYLINRLSNSKFMLMMKNHKPVKSPIMKTQIIIKNPDYKNAYLLWLYLDRYRSLGYQEYSESRKKRISLDYSKQLDKNILFLLSTFLKNDTIDNPKVGDYTKASYKVRKAKTEPRLIDELNFDPKEFEVDDNNLSEYMLDKAKKIVDKYFKIKQAKIPNYKKALESTIDEMILIFNSIYEKTFEIDSDVDIFERLIKETNPIDELKQAKDKYLTAKIIRERKEKDYKNSINLEKKWLNSLNLIQENFIDYENSLIEEKINKSLNEEKEKLLTDLLKVKNSIAKEKNVFIRQEKEKLKIEEKKIKERYRQAKEKLKIKERLKLKKEKEKLRKTIELQKKREKEKLKKEKESIRRKNLTRIQKEKSKLKDVS